MKTDLFQSCGHCWVFQICWHIDCSTFTASSFRIWNSSTGILSPPLALFVVMLPKAHLTRVAYKSIDLINECLEYNLCYPKPCFLSTKPYYLSKHAHYLLVLDLSYHWETLWGLMSSSSPKWTIDLSCLGTLLFKFHCIDSQWPRVYIVWAYYAN